MSDKIKVPKQTPGKIYSSISVESRDFSVSENKLTKRKQNTYVKFCKKIYKQFPSLGKNGKFNKKTKDAIDFLNWELDSEEYTAGTKFVLMFGSFLTLISIILLYVYFLDSITKMFSSVSIAYLIVIGVPLFTFLYLFSSFQKYPLNAVKSEKVKALTFVPEILGYMVMSMKLVPNLEKAIEFAAHHGHGKISEDLKKLLWEVKVGIKSSVAEALDELAYKWGDVSPELKKALMKIRASVIEVSEAKRFQILDQTIKDTLVSIKNKLEDYARSLTQPSMVIFYLGVLLPLLLIIVLPVGSAFSGSAMARPIYLILIYNLLIPIFSILYTKKIIKNRPATYVPPKIPDNHPDLPPKHTIRFGKLNINVFIIMIVVGVLFIGGSLYLQNQFGFTKHKFLVADGYISADQPNSAAQFRCTPPEIIKKQKDPNFQCQSEVEYWQDPAHNTTPFYLIYGILFTISLLLSLFLYSESAYKRKIQLQSEKMEDEFKDALYIIASRLGENKPIEDALSYSTQFLSKSLIAKNIFEKTINNIRVLGLNLNSSLFDPNYGALKNNPSTIINSAMRLMVDSVQLGVSVAAKTLMSYSIQLRNTDEVAKTLKNLIESITQTLTSMAKFIAPIVLGITTALQKVVISTLTSVSNSGALSDMQESVNNISKGVNSLGGSLNVSSVSSMGQIDPTVIAKMASSTTFLIIVAIYIIEIVIIIIYFTTMIEQDNITLTKLRIAKTLPISIIIFILTTIFANMIF